jgi:tRNA-dihydrouridine synthase B
VVALHDAALGVEAAWRARGTLDPTHRLAPVSGLSVRIGFDGGVATTELIAPELLLDAQQARRLLAFDAERERPFSVQLHGQDEALMARAALVAAEHGADVIDLNMGNPLRGAGESFLLEPQRAARMLSLLRRVTGLPITVKTRAGMG